MSAPPPPAPKTPAPMVPVPRALGTVLAETARTLWFRRRDGDGDGNDGIASCLQLLGRISATDVRAPSPGYPDHAASIMDGYAVRTRDLAAARAEFDGLGGEVRAEFVLDFVVAGRVYAGDDEDSTRDDALSGAGGIRRTAVYITTGAVVPAGYDAVVPVEDTAVVPPTDGGGLDRIRIVPSRVESVLESTEPNTWIRPVGCDIPPGSIVLSRGEIIRPVHMALLAQVGICLDEVRVNRLPRVGVLSTGNELVDSNKASTDASNAAGKIPDVNRPLLLSQLSTYGNCVPVDLGIVTDDDGYDAIARKLNEILWAEDRDGGVDVLVTTGGISMGEKDIMERVFVEGMGGKVRFGRMNMKPGKPTTFVTIDSNTERGRRRRIVFALPGNPVSASVCGELLVRPCLDLLHDGIDDGTSSDNLTEEAFVERATKNARVHEEVMATITADIKLDQGRPEYRRVVLQRVPAQDGGRRYYTYEATSTGVQRSSRVLSLRGADGLMVLPRGGPSGCGQDVAKKGSEFPVLLYSSLSGSSGTRFGDSMHRGMLESHEHHKHGHKHKHHHGHNHHGKSTEKLALGVVICTSSDEHRDASDFQSIDATIVSSLGGDERASVVKRRVCRMDDVFPQKLADIIGGNEMEGANVIFVVVPSQTYEGSGAIAFRAGLEVSHALHPVLAKEARAMALQVRRGAASRDASAAVFENVVGTVRDGSCVLITCSDRGLEGAVGAVKGLLGHLTALIGATA